MTTSPGPAVGTASAPWQTAALALLAAGIQVQIILPIGAVGLKVCPADLVAGVLTLLLLVRRVRFPALPLSIAPRLPLWLALATGALSLAFVIGYVRMGHISGWALSGKLLGWFGLLSYLASGLWIGASMGDRGRRRFVGLFIGISVACGSAAMFFALVLFLLRILPDALTNYPLRGFVDNRNAFAFLMLAAMSLLMAVGRCEQPLFSPWLRSVLCGICGLCIVYSGSRSAIPLMAILVALALWLRAIDLRSVAGAVCSAIVAWATLEVARAILLYAYQLNSTNVNELGSFGKGMPTLFGQGGRTVVPSDTTAGSSDMERLTGYMEAVDLWLTAPIFGAGLGVFIDNHLAHYHTPVIIHNTVLWLLTETGVVGLAAFGGLAWNLARPLVPKRESKRSDGEAFRLAAFLFLLVFAAMALVHEMLYQRVLWLMLGLGLAAAGGRSGSSCAE